MIWDPAILAGAAEHGLYLTRENMMVDTFTGADKPSDNELMPPLTPEVIAGFRRYTVEEMAARVTTADERRWSAESLLCNILPDGKAALAPVIGPGMTQDRNAAPKVTNPHGFSVEWLRIEPGSRIGPFRIDPKQIFIIQSGQLMITLDGEDGASKVEAGPWDTFAAPARTWRTLTATGDEPAVMTVVTAGDARAIIEWDDEIVRRAWDAGVGLDPNDYLAPAKFLPVFSAPKAP
ncbi:MAG: cupin domain-containing protein [Sphingomonas sp.]|nr:MAG: cupin domain-containing protein [Sphingomonas sp.]